MSHANNGLLITIFGAALATISWIPILGWLVSGVCYIFAFVCMIIGIVHACKGEKKPLPLIGKYTILH